MASKAVVDAVEARLAAHWARCPVVGPDLLNKLPADGSPYLLLQYPYARERPIATSELGRRSFREEGVIRLALHAPRGRGIAPWLDWIEELRALFATTEVGIVCCLAPSPAAIDEDSDRGSYVVLSSAVPYFAELPS